MTKILNERPSQAVILARTAERLASLMKRSSFPVIFTFGFDIVSELVLVFRYDESFLNEHVDL